VEDELTDITVDVHLYGDLARYGNEVTGYGSANLQVRLPKGSVVRDLLAHLRMPTEKRGITFVNGKMSAMPGMQPDLDLNLNAGDRVAFFDLKSMWPFQYRHGAIVTDEIEKVLSTEKDKRLHYTDGTQYRSN
jgi:hypothetical protein